jgi:hypothetical protein
MLQETRAVFVESLRRVLGAFARLAPGILALVLIVIVSGVAALLVRMGLERICRRLSLDDRARQWGLVRRGEGAPSPSRMIARFGAWSVLALGAALSIQVLDATAAPALAHTLFELARRIIVAVILVAAAVVVAGVLAQKALIGAVNAGIQWARLLALGVRWLVIVTGTAMALQQLGVGGLIVPVGFGLIVGGIVLALALAVGLGAQHAVSRTIEKQLGRREEEEPGEEQEIHHT